MHQALHDLYNDGRQFKLHYVTAREAYNIAKAAEHGLDGDPSRYRDFRLAPNATRYYVADAPHRLVAAAHPRGAGAESRRPSRVRLRDLGVREVRGSFGRSTSTRPGHAAAGGLRGGRITVEVVLGAGAGAGVHRRRRSRRRRRGRREVTLPSQSGSVVRRVSTGMIAAGHLPLGAVLAIVYPYAIYPALIWLKGRIWPRPGASAALGRRRSRCSSPRTTRSTASATPIANKLAQDYPAEPLQIIVISDGSSRRHRRRRADVRRSRRPAASAGPRRGEGGRAECRR